MPIRSPTATSAGARAVIPAHMAPWPFIIVAGAAIGVLLGIFGVGGSSVATQCCRFSARLPSVAVASPLPAIIPAAILAAVPYVQTGDTRRRAAIWSLVGGVPATIAGALLTRVVGGSSLLVASGIVLIVIGVRVIRPIGDAARAVGARRRQNRPLLVGAAAGVGLFTGLLANGGGFLLVPLYLLVFGMRMRQAVGTSLVVIAVLSIPTLATHWALGHINWAVAALSPPASCPGAAVSSRLAHRIAGPVVRRAFGWFLISFGAFFTLYRLLGR